MIIFTGLFSPLDNHYDLTLMIVCVCVFELRGDRLANNTSGVNNTLQIESEIAQLAQDEILIDDYIERMHDMIKEISENPHLSS